LSGILSAVPDLLNGVSDMPAKSFNILRKLRSTSSDRRSRSVGNPVHLASEYAHSDTDGVGFAEAVAVLGDEFALTREDPDSEGEQRFVTLGANAEGQLLVVVYTYRDPDVTRLISAWKANKTQRTQYESHRR
jgi:hypothetical protein